MRTLLIAAVIIALLTLLGWVSFSADESGANVRLHTDEAARDVEETVERTGRGVNEALEPTPATVD